MIEVVFTLLDILLLIALNYCISVKNNIIINKMIDK